MKIKAKTPDRLVVGFSRREIAIINNCLQEACHGLILDRFVPAHDQLGRMLDCTRGIVNSQDIFKVKPAAL